MSIKVEDRVTVDGEVREAQEVFRASGTIWIRYLRKDGSNGYASEMEWMKWRCGITE